MKRHKGTPYLLAGLWISLVAVLMAGSTLLPHSTSLAENSAALLYKVALNEELRKATTIPLAGRVIRVDLDDMKLALYEDSVPVRTFPILSRGRPGTFWETPTGTYAVQTKEPKHFSSIGGTWMPYSMQFYGNFFIHGWPTHTDGTPVPRGYSGGCIRMGTDDAKVVYEFASIGTKVIVTGGAPKDIFATSSRYYLRLPGSTAAHLSPEIALEGLPNIRASTFVVADVESGNVLWERNADRSKEPMGLSAMVTALTALETVDQYKIVRMSELLLGKSVLRKHSVGADDELPVGALIYPLLFGSNDTAAKVFARAGGTKNFVSSMNAKAAAIGMANTSFGGALSTDRATSTARDLFVLMHYIDRSKHFLLDASLADERIYVGAGSTRYRWENKGPWVREPDARYQGGLADVREGGAGDAMVIFALPMSEFGDRRIAFVVLDSPDIEGDVERLRGFVSDHFTYGIEHDGGAFVREVDEPTPSLLERAKALLDLHRLIEEDVIYERDV